MTNAVAQWMQDNSTIINWFINMVNVLGSIALLFRLWFVRPRRTIGLSVIELYASMLFNMANVVVFFALVQPESYIPNMVGVVVTLATILTYHILECRMPRMEQLVVSDSEAMLRLLDTYTERGIPRTSSRMNLTAEDTPRDNGFAKIIRCSDGVCSIVLTRRDQLNERRDSSQALTSVTSNPSLVDRQPRITAATTTTTTKRPRIIGHILVDNPTRKEKRVVLNEP